MTRDDYIEFQTNMRSMTASLKSLESRITQIERSNNERALGNLPSDTIPNPKGKDLEHCKAIHLRSESVLPDRIVGILATQCENPEVIETLEESDQEESEPVVIPEDTPPAEEHGTPKVTPPFPIKLKKKKKKEVDPAMRKFIQTLETVQINLPLIDLLRQIPRYFKYLKDMVAERPRLDDASFVTLNEECSATISKQIPTKEKDPGSFCKDICSRTNHFRRTCILNYA